MFCIDLSLKEQNWDVFLQIISLKLLWKYWKFESPIIFRLAQEAFNKGALHCGYFPPLSLIFPAASSVKTKDLSFFSSFCSLESCCNQSSIVAAPCVKTPWLLLLSTCRRPHDKVMCVSWIIRWELRHRGQNMLLYSCVAQWQPMLTPPVISSGLIQFWHQY